MNHQQQLLHTISAVGLMTSLLTACKEPEAQARETSVGDVLGTCEGESKVYYYVTDSGRSVFSRDEYSEECAA